MFQRFSKSILFAPLFSLLLGGVFVVSCGDDDNEEKVQDSSSNQNADNGSSDNGNGGGFVFDGKDKEYTVNGVSFKMIAVKGGTFQMGSNDGYDNEKPVHQVTLTKGYYIGETEVTQELWCAVMGSNPSNFTGNMMRPVEKVSWNDCQCFISKLNELTGEAFCLPTEAQWEYAARGGNKSKGYIFSGSNNFENVAWCNESYTGSSHPVKTKAPNELGIYDMSGNVSEWCSDWYNSYSSSVQTDPAGPSTGYVHVCRGGDWIDGAHYCCVASRLCYSSSDLYNFLGMRLAL